MKSDLTSSERRVSACSGKNVYTFKAACQSERGSKKWGARLNKYHCNFCHGWHLGNPAKKIRRV